MDERWPQTVELEKEVDPGQLAAELAAARGLGPWEDDLGNLQAGFRLSLDDGRVTVEFRARADEKVVRQVVEAHEPPAPAERERGQALAALRGERDARLASSDWTQLMDAPLSDAKRKAWADYRTALRDLPGTADPADLTWPDPPS